MCVWCARYRMCARSHAHEEAEGADKCQAHQRQEDPEDDAAREHAAAHAHDAHVALLLRTLSLFTEPRARSLNVLRALHGRALVKIRAGRGLFDTCATHPRRTRVKISPPHPFWSLPDILDRATVTC